MNLLSIPNPVYVMSPAKISFIYFFQVEKNSREKSRKILMFTEKEKMALCSIWTYIINTKITQSNTVSSGICRLAFPSEPLISVLKSKYSGFLLCRLSTRNYQ